MGIPVILIEDPTVTSERRGDYTFEEQEGKLILDPSNEAKSDRLTIRVPVIRGRAPYLAGRYVVDGRSFDRDKYGRLGLARDLVLSPLAKA